MVMEKELREGPPPTETTTPPSAPAVTIGETESRQDEEARLDQEMADLEALLDGSER